MTIEVMGGKYTYTELMTMDLPLQKALIQGHMANEARAHERAQELAQQKASEQEARQRVKPKR